MTKEIISKGVDRYKTTCPECGCYFSYERGDVHTNYVRGGERISCPSCGHSCRHVGAGWYQTRVRWSCGDPRSTMFWTNRMQS